jgi:DNA-binding response OmpR family regulator
MEKNCVAALPLDGCRILILEDEYLIAMDVEQICRDHGAEDAVLVGDITELAADVFDQKFDVAVLDAMLNGHSTLDFARRLRDRNVPFVFATGYGDVTERFADFPDIPVVGKPYSGRDLIEAIASVIGRGAPQAMLEPNT